MDLTNVCYMYTIYIMKRTQVYLPEEQVESIKVKASQLGVAKAEVIRRALRAGLKAIRKKGDPLRGMERLVETAVPGPEDLAENMDEYLYGDKSEYAQKNSD